MRSLLILSLLSVFTTTCRHRPNSALMAACEGKFGAEFQACLSGEDSASLEDKSTSDLQNAAGAAASDQFGMIYNIRQKGDDNSCLTQESGKWSWQQCETWGIGQQFHFDDRVEIKYALKKDTSGQPLVLKGTAFRIHTRDSVNIFLNLHECTSTENPADGKCIVLGETDHIAEKGQQVALQCLSLDKWGNPITVPCDQAVYFIHMPNKYGDNDGLQEKNIFTSLVALVDKTQEIDETARTNLKALTPKESECNPVMAQIMGEDCSTQKPSAAPKNPEPLDLSKHFMDRGNSCDSFRFINRDSRDRSKVTGKCPSSAGLAEEQNANKWTYMLIDACESSANSKAGQCFQDGSIKDFTDHLVDIEKGAVVAVMLKTKTDRCLKVGENNKLTYEDCKDGKNDTIDEQFRMAKVSSRTNGESNMQLRAMADNTMCADLKELKLVKCEGQEKTYIYDGSSNDLRQEKDQTLYTFHACSIVTNHNSSGEYDCYYQIPAKIKRWQKLSFALGFLALAILPVAILGAPLLAVEAGVLALSVPSYVFDGLVCASGDPVAAAGSCMGLQMGIVIDIATINFGGKAASSAAFKFAGTRAFLSDNETFGTALAKTILYTGRKLARSKLWRPDHAANALNSSILQMIRRNKFTRAQLKSIFVRVREEPGRTGCGVMNCNHPLMPFPRRNEIDAFIDGPLAESLKSSTIDETRKEAIAVLLSAKSKQEDITRAQAKL